MTCEQNVVMRFAIYKKRAVVVELNSFRGNHWCPQSLTFYLSMQEIIIDENYRTLHPLMSSSVLGADVPCENYRVL